MPRKRDILDAYIEVMHHLLGHDRCADYLGVPRYDKSKCILCHPKPEKKVSHDKSNRVDT
jgi:hypothetical protein